MIYPEGNFIEAGADNPVLSDRRAQIRPPDHHPHLRCRRWHSKIVAKLLLVSFDSTIRSNLSVGLPIDLQFYETDSYEPGYRRRFDQRDPYYQLNLGRVVGLPQGSAFDAAAAVANADEVASLPGGPAEPVFIS